MTVLSEMIGKTLSSIKQTNSNFIDFYGDTDEHWRMYYKGGYCIQCKIEDIIGDLNYLIGSPIVMAEESTSSSEYDDSVTWTFYKFATAKGYVAIRWYETSNGYYNETVSFKGVL